MPPTQLSLEDVGAPAAAASARGRRSPQVARPRSPRANPLADMSLREFLSVAQPLATSDDPDRHLSRDEAAEFLGVPAKTVENLARAQRLPSVLVGRRRVYRRSALLARMLEAERTGLGI